MARKKNFLCEGHSWEEVTSQLQLLIYLLKKNGEKNDKKVDEKICEILVRKKSVKKSMKNQRKNFCVNHGKN